MRLFPIHKNEEYTINSELRDHSPTAQVPIHSYRHLEHVFPGTARSRRTKGKAQMQTKQTSTRGHPRAVL
jgi:hypothetical protein